jgi:hypothetical protein
MYVDNLLPEGVARGFPLKAVLLPCVTGLEDTRLEPASPADALLALAPSTILQLPGAGGAALRLLAAVAARLPCYWLRLGTDLDRAAGAIQDLLAHERG